MTRKLIFAIFLLACTKLSFAQSVFSYQGLLLDNAKKLVTGNHNVSARLYLAPTGDVPLHEEVFETSVENGLFNIQIGSSVPISQGITFDKKYWVGISVDNGEELTPRTLLTSVPSAMYAESAGSLTAGAKGVVTKLNGKSGDLIIKAGLGTAVETNGKVITISAIPVIEATPQDVAHSVTGTANQVLVDGSYGVQKSGDVTLTLPQDINSGATPQFSNINLSAIPAGSSYTNVLVSNGGVLQTRTIASLGSGVSSVTGTANQVNVSSATGDVTFSLPQNINTGATPQFANINLTGIPSGSTYANVLVSNGGVLQTRAVSSLGWGLFGNAGTTTGTNFIGTTDGQNLQLRINNVPSGMIEFNGNLNTGLGYKALINNTSGNYNAAIGYESLYLNTTGSQNTAEGLQSLQQNTTGSNNSAHGTFALKLNTTGVSNTADGAYTLNSNSTGSYNTATGFNALPNNNSDYNTAVGASTLYYNSTGYANTAVGYQSLFSNSTGFDNTGIGITSLYSNNTGSYNTAIGRVALYTNTSGNWNTAVGEAALASNTTGSFNSASGDNVLQFNTTGVYNTGSGYTALYHNTTGNYNTSNGGPSLFSNTTGSNNTADGYNALNANITGSNNTALGSGANVTSGALSNATAIGYNAMVGASNSLVLGGTGGDAVKVGIGISNPSQTLDVVGNIQFSGALMPGSNAGISGQFLTSQGAGNAPAWTSPGTHGLVSAVAGTTQIINDAAVSISSTIIVTIEGTVTFGAVTARTAGTSFTVTSGAALVATDKINYQILP